MRLEFKLGISSGVFVLAMLSSASCVHWRLAGVARVAYEIDEQRRPFMITALDLNRHLSNAVAASQSAILFTRKSRGYAAGVADLAQAHQAIDSDLSALTNIEARLDLGSDEGKLEVVARQVRELERQQRLVVRQSYPGTVAAAARARTLLERQVLPLNAIAQTTLTAIVDSQGRVVSNRVAALRHAGDMSVLTVWTATLLGLLLGCPISFVIARQVVRGLTLVLDRASAIAAGDLTGADLDIGPSDQAGRLAHAIERMQNNLSGIISTVARTASSLSTSATSMSAAAEHIHRRADRQTQQTEQAATSMQEMSASIAEVSRHAQSAAETARSAAQTAREGGEIVAQTLTSMHAIASAAQDAASTIGLLGEDSRRISQIVTVIDEIATKTNLLALNAAIEAARAGDHGRGFAVVAGEVRHLAENTAQATGEIATMIQEIQQRSRTAIASMASGRLTVEEGVTTTTKAGEALERIIGIAERVERMIAQIAIAASQQASSANQSSASLESIHSLSLDNLAEMAATAANIDSLRETAASLESKVASFRLGPSSKPQASTTRFADAMRLSPCKEESAIQLVGESGS